MPITESISYAVIPLGMQNRLQRMTTWEIVTEQYIGMCLAKWEPTNSQVVSLGQAT